MQSRDAIHITPAEWRWVVLFSVLLVGVAFFPFLWVAVTSGTQWQFMGVLNNYRDGATYLSKMVQGMEGSWLVHFQHTPEDHVGAFIQVIYPALGQLARILSIPPIALFHAVRVIASLVMYMALYQLGASIWTRLRARRIFFALAAIGSGFGWLLAPLTGNPSFPDLTIAEIYPFFSSLVNVHFPLALACLALLSSILIVAFRPGSKDNPDMNNGGMLAVLLSFALSLLYPQTLVPIGGATGLYIAILWLRTRRFALREFRWLLVIVLPAVPIAAYYGAIVTYNPVMVEWNRQNITASPSPLILALGLGFPLLLALPGIYRGIRRFEPDGDQFMLLWLATIVIAMYIPGSIQRRFAAGLMIPIAYFATRALEDFWFQYANRRWRYRVLISVAPLMTVSYALLLLSNLTVAVGPFLPRDYGVTLRAMKDIVDQNDVVLASEEVSLWVPGWTGARVVYGHPYETLEAQQKRQQVLDWYSGKGDCDALLQQYHVQYVIVGPLEEALGTSPCIANLKLIDHYGAVNLYAP
jgi:hypothetical protein